MKNEVTDAAIADYDRRNAEYFERIQPKTNELPDDLPLSIKDFLEQL
jgi:hypothetical protein